MNALPRTIQKLRRTLSGGAVIVVEHSAEAAPASHRSVTTSETGIRENEQIADALVISLAVIVRHELANGCPQRVLAEQNQPVQTGLLDGSHKSLGICVQVW